MWNEDDAKLYVEHHSDGDDHDETDLTNCFRALYEREPDDDDISNGLWSLCCAAVLE